MQNDYKELQNGQEKMQNGYRDEKWQQRDANKPPKRWKMTTKDLKTAKEKSTNDYKEIQNNQKEMQDKKEMQNKRKVMPNVFVQNTFQPHVRSEMGLDDIQILKSSLCTSWVVL